MGCPGFRNGLIIEGTLRNNELALLFETPFARRLFAHGTADAVMSIVIEFINRNKSIVIEVSLSCLNAFDKIVGKYRILFGPEQLVAFPRVFSRVSGGQD